MREYDDLAFGRGVDVNRDNLNRPIRRFDERLHALEQIKADYNAEVERLRAITLDQVTVLLADTAAVVRGLASLGTVLSARSASSKTIGLGEVTMIVNEADRAKVPTAGYVAAVATGTEASMGGFILFYSQETGELRFHSTITEGDGTYSDWTIGLAAPTAAPAPDQVPQSTQDHVEEKIGTALAPVTERIDVLEAVPPPDPTFVMAYAKYRSAA